jgi:hypothetical protein
MKKFLLIFIVSFLNFSLSSCATKNVPLQKEFWGSKDKKVTVAMNKLPKAALYQRGAQGLLDMAIAEIATTSFANKLKYYEAKQFAAIKSEFVKRLREQGKQVVIYQDNILTNKLPSFHKNTSVYAAKNYMPYLGHVGSDKLLLISLKKIGAARSYYGFIPLEDPKAFCEAEGRLIDLKTNRILWRQHANVTMTVKGKWDQAPHYPNFIKTLDKVVAEAKRQLLYSFFGPSKAQNIMNQKSKR